MSNFIKDVGLVSADEVRSVLDYDAKSGELTWRAYVGKSIKPGQKAGCKHERRGTSEAVIGYKGRLYQLHRIAWLHYYGSWPTGVIDHINGDRSDNRIENLRDCSQRENLANRRAVGNSTGRRGVSHDKERDKYVARIRLSCGKRVWLGRFDCVDDAAKAYENAYVKEYGRFAKGAAQ